MSRRRTMLIKILAVVLSGPLVGEDPPFIGGFSEKILKVHFRVSYAVILFITHNTRILFHKARLYKSIRFIFTCVKSLYSQSELRTAISHVKVKGFVWKRGSFALQKPFLLSITTKRSCWHITIGDRKRGTIFGRMEISRPLHRKAKILWQLENLQNYKDLYWKPLERD